jgi:hypothetical protein
MGSSLSVSISGGFCWWLEANIPTQESGDVTTRSSVQYFCKVMATKTQAQTSRALNQPMLSGEQDRSVWHDGDAKFVSLSLTETCV